MSFDPPRKPRWEPNWPRSQIMPSNSNNMDQQRRQRMQDNNGSRMLGPRGLQQPPVRGPPAQLPLLRAPRLVLQQPQQLQQRQQQQSTLPHGVRENMRSGRPTDPRPPPLPTTTSTTTESRWSGGTPWWQQPQPQQQQQPQAGPGVNTSRGQQQQQQQQSSSADSPSRSSRPRHVVRTTPAQKRQQDRDRARDRRLRPPPLNTTIVSGRVGNLAYTVTRVEDRRFKTLRLSQHNYSLNFRVLASPNSNNNNNTTMLMIDHFHAIYDAVRRLHEFLQRQYADSISEIFVQYALMSNGLNPSVNLPLMPLSYDEAPDDLLYALEKVLNSDDSILLDESLRVSAVLIDVPHPASNVGAARNLSRSNGGSGGMPRANVKKKKKKKKVLGEEFHSMKAERINKWVTLAPDLGGPLTDCCLLTGIVLGMLYCHEMKTCEHLKTIRNAKTDAWKILKYLHSPERNGARHEKAVAFLRQQVREFSRNFEIDINKFRLAKVEDVREEITKFGINLHVYSEECCFELVFRHPPEKPDVSLPTVSLLLTRNPERNVLHTGLIRRVSKFYSAKRLAICLQCNKLFTRKYLRAHRCPVRERCPLCKRALIKPGDYTDYPIRQDCCASVIAPEGMIQKCDTCQRRPKTAACAKLHETLCSRNEMCLKCNIVFRVNPDREHVCGDKWCESCRHITNELQDGKHLCWMGAPKPPLEWKFVLFFDFESELVGDNIHRVNSVGVTWEVKPGVFSEVLLFDEDMNHEEDGVVKHEIFEFHYWSDRLDPKKIKFKTKPKNFRPFIPIRRPGHGVVSRSNNNPTMQEEEDDEEEPSRRRRRLRSLASQFISAEAAVDYDDDEEEEEEEDDDELDPVEREERRQQQRRRGRGILDSSDENDDEDEMDSDLEEERLLESSALNKFIDRFVNETMYGTVWIAHCSGRYDSHLLLRALLRRNVEVEPILQGQNILRLRLVDLKIDIIDSYRYISMALDQFPARFPDTLSASCKGTFPHAFNRKSNYFYRGSIPDLSYFLDKFTSERKTQAIKEFHAEFQASGQVWDYQKEHAKYLAEDIRILRGGCLSLIKEFVDYQDSLKLVKLPFHPFVDYFTASSFSHALYRFFGLKSKTMYLTENPTNARKTSTLELEWLGYMAHINNCTIRTAFNHESGQTMAGRYALDGYDAENRTCYEFLGCLHHGHCTSGEDCSLSKGLTRNSRTPFGKLNHEVYTLWLRKKAALENGETPLGSVKVVYEWECAYLKQKEDDDRLKEFLEDYYVSRPQERLVLRRGLRGGRTEPFRQYYHQEENEGSVMFFLDVVSLYPAQACQKSFPIGPPTVLIDKKLEDIRLDKDKGFVMKTTGKKVYGLMHCKVLAPPSIFLPALPYSYEDRLYYALCRTCVHQHRPGFCTHTDEERAFTDVYVSVELEYAVNVVGYKLLELHEAYIYKEASPHFAPYYTRLAKMKLGAEGWPREDMTPQEKETYIQRLNSEMPGLNMQAKDVQKNTGKRAFAKFLQNAGLGKLSQNEDKVGTRMATNWHDIAALLYSPDKDLLTVQPLTSNVAQLRYRPKLSRAGLNRATQVVVYSFVTSYGRLAMLKHMRFLQMELGASIFYMDTDSIVFCMSDKSHLLAKLDKEFKLESKAYGTLSHETATPVVSFSCISSKNYSLRCEDGFEKVRVRGFSLTNKTAKAKINHETMRAMLLDAAAGIDRTVEVDQFGFKLDVKQQRVQTHHITKKYKNFGLTPKRFLPLSQDMPGDKFMTLLPYGVKHTNFADIPQ